MLNEEQQVSGAVAETSKDLTKKGQLDVDKLVMHPHEIMVLKQLLSSDLKRFLSEVYAEHGQESLDHINKFDVKRFAQGLEERGHSPQDAVMMTANKVALDLAEKINMKHQLEDTSRPGMPTTKEEAEVEALRNKYHETPEKWDPAFAKLQAEHAIQVDQNRARLEAKRNRKVGWRHDEDALEDAPNPNPVETPDDIVAGVIQHVDQMESTGGPFGQQMPSDTHAFGPVDYAMAAATRFYGDKEKFIAEYAKRKSIDRSKVPSHELELDALRDYATKEGLRRASNISSKRRRQQEALDNGEKFDENAFDAEKAEKKLAQRGAVTETDTSFCRPRSGGFCTGAGVAE